MSKRILVLGAQGYVGRQVISALIDRPRVERIVAFDIKPPSNPCSSQQSLQVSYVTGDIRDFDFEKLCLDEKIDSVIHLASIVKPTKSMTRKFLYDVEVAGTERVLKACIKASVKQIVITSSGAAYGYHKDNKDYLSEDEPLRGNYAFAYAYHKRKVEELLTSYRSSHPELAQLVLRPGTILGDNTHNPITDIFKKPFILGISGAKTPFVMIWDQDVIAIIVAGVLEFKTGIYNLAGDGTLSLRDIAQKLDKPYVAVPSVVVQGALWILAKLGLTQYGPEQVDFLRYRPVLSNERLKSIFGYSLTKSTEETFEDYARAQGLMN